MSPQRLVWITPEAESQIVYCARVSNPKSQEEGKSPDRLIRYLAKHKHWSPFEMASACFEINTTRDIAAQILRHRSFSFQEFSQRYSESNLLGHAPIPELRFQDHANKQNSLDDDFGVLADEFEERIRDVFEATDKLYQDMLVRGVAKESARKILPLNTPTRLYMSGTIRSWIHYLQIRTGVETQREHRDVALGIQDILREHLPSIYTALLCPKSTLPLNRPERLSPLFPPEPAFTMKPNGFFGRLVSRFKPVSP
jgi:thymidylate synthase (FAD)